MEKNLEELANRLNDAYNEIARMGVVINRKEFAALIGVASTTLSSAMNGNQKMLTEAIVIKAENAVRNAKAATSAEPTQKAPDAPACEVIKGEDVLDVMRDMCACVNKMCDTLDKERESHERIITSMLEAFKR